MPQVLEHRLLDGRLLLQLLPATAYSARDPAQWQTLGAVSYTHLTLPTKRIV